MTMDTINNNDKIILFMTLNINEIYFHEISDTNQ